MPSLQLGRGPVVRFSDPGRPPGAGSWAAPIHGVTLAGIRLGDGTGGH